ncbi:MAG: phosphoenolpyruvate--protein phosphotransferase [Lachnospiraceae bacterium]
MFKGIGASAGVGIGKVVIIKDQEVSITESKISDVAAEKARFQDAIEKFIAKTQAMADDMKERLGAKEAEILEGHLLISMDPEFSGQVEGIIESELLNAEAALNRVGDQFIALFSSIPDEMFQQRATDVADVRARILKNLAGIEEVDISALPAGTILVAEDLTPSMTAGINNQNVVGIMTEVGGKTSHSAILARALEIPAVLSIEGGILNRVNDGDLVIVDGSEGDVIVGPTEDEVAAYTKKRNEYLEAKEALKKFIGQPSQTSDGHVVELVCNIGKPEDVTKVIECDGEGVGLFRTEFLFMDHDSAPSEEEQFEAYKKVAESLEGKPVIIRTLDIGGDKAVPYMGLEQEENPFLGYRAVRLCLDRVEDLYRPQLRALLRASAYGNIKIMVPLVTCVDELRAVKALVEEIKAELDAEGIAYNKDIPVGIMMETAAASVIADILAEEAAFFSIGTNDLIGYTMAVDRGNAKVAYLYKPFQPAVVRSIQRIISAAKKTGIMVGMCGEVAADPLMIPVLLGFGLDEFSVSATSVLATRKIMSEWTKEEAEALAAKVVEMKTSDEIYECLKAAQK